MATTIVGPCPNCGSNKYNQDVNHWALTQLDGDSLQLGKFFALIVVSCRDCGFIKLFNRNIAGEITV